MNSGEAALPSFGQVVVDTGLATREDVEDCLRDQESRNAHGDFVRLGQIFVERGILTPDEVQHVLSGQNLQIRSCARCATQYNWAFEESRASENCPRCGGLLVEPDVLHSLAVEDTFHAEFEEEELEREQGLRILHSHSRSFGPFEIIGEISRGGMGIVYKANEKDLGRIVALKVLLAGGESADEDIDRFQREAQAVARLRHPAIVEIHRVGVHQSIHYFSMHYIQGISLDDLIEEGQTEQSKLVEIVREIARAVDCAHQGGVLHRDIKPANILVDRKGQPFLIDFGIAKFRDERRELTSRGTFLGSPQYMPPEYISGQSRAFDVRSDIYALGVTLYKIITGLLPYPEGDTIQILRRILSGPPSLDRKLTEVPRDLALICLRAIERNPNDRYETARLMAVDLTRYLAGEEVSVRPRGLLFRLRRWLRHRASVVFSIGLTLALILGLWALHSTATAHSRRADELQRQLEESLDRSRDLQYLLHLERGKRLVAESRLTLALGHLNLAVELLPDRPEAYQERSVVLERLGRHEEAQADEQKARRLSRRR